MGTAVVGTGVVVAVLLVVGSGRGTKAKQLTGLHVPGVVGLGCVGADVRGPSVFAVGLTAVARLVWSVLPPGQVDAVDDPSEAVWSRKNLVVRLATAVVMVVVMAVVPLVIVKVFVTTAATGSTHPKRPSRYLFMAFASPLPRLFAITALLHIGDGCPTHSLFIVSWHRSGGMFDTNTNEWRQRQPGLRREG